MFNIAGRPVWWLALINAAIVFTAVLIISYFSNLKFGVAVGLAIVMIALTIPAFTIRFFGNEWRIRLPIIGNASFWTGVLVIIVVWAFFSALAGEEMIESWHVNFNVERSQKAAEAMIYIVNPGWCFYENKKAWEELTVKTSGKFLNEEKKTADGEKILKFRLIGKRGLYDGLVVWVPILQCKKESWLSKNFPKTQVSSSNGHAKRMASKKIKGSGTKGVLILTSDEVYQQDLYGDSIDKIKLILTKKFKKGDIVAFQEDFCLLRKGGPAEALTILWVNNKRIKNFAGNCIPAGTRFQLREEPLLLLFQAYRASSVSSGRLNLKKVN